MSCKDALKVGKTINCAARRRSHQTSNPFPVALRKKWRVSSMSEAEESLKCALCHWRLRGEWYCPPADVRKVLFSIRCLETVLRLGADQPSPVIPPAEPIPDEFKRFIVERGKGTLAIISPRSTLLHVLCVVANEVWTFCGELLSADNYWRLKDKTIAPASYGRLRECPRCASVVFNLADFGLDPVRGDQFTNLRKLQGHV